MKLPRDQKKNGGGVLRELSHELDNLNWLFPSCTREFCYAHGFNSGSLQIDNTIDDIYSIYGQLNGSDITLNNELKISLNFCSLIPYRKYRFITRERCFEWDGIKHTLTEAMPGHEAVIMEECGQDDVVSSYGRLFKDFRRWLQDRKGGYGNLCSYEEALIVCKQIDYIEKLNRSRLVEYR